MMGLKMGCSHRITPRSVATWPCGLDGLSPDWGIRSDSHKYAPGTLLVTCSGNQPASIAPANIGTVQPAALLAVQEVPASISVSRTRANQTRLIYIHCFQYRQPYCVDVPPWWRDGLAEKSSTAAGAGHLCFNRVGSECTG